MAKPARLYREKTRHRFQAEAAAARRAARRRRRRIGGAAAGTAVTVGAVATFAAMTYTGHPSSTPTSRVPAATATPARPVRGTPVCDFRAAPSDPGRHVALPPDRRATADGTVVLATSRGRVTFTLDAHCAPCATTAVSWLAHQRYYNGTTCPVLAKTATVSLLQCGAQPGITRSGPGFNLPEEGVSGATYPRGTVALNRTASAAHSTGSQFLIIYKDGRLPARYTPLAHVTAGLTVIDAIAAGGIQTGRTVGAPTLPVTVDSATATP